MSEKHYGVAVRMPLVTQVLLEPISRFKPLEVDYEDSWENLLIFRGAKEIPEYELLVGCLCEAKIPYEVFHMPQNEEDHFHEYVSFSADGKKEVLMKSSERMEFDSVLEEILSLAKQKRIADIIDVCNKDLVKGPVDLMSWKIGHNSDRVENIPNNIRFDHPVIGQECLCPDGIGRVVAWCDNFPNQWVQVETYIKNRGCKWAPHNVKLFPLPCWF